MLNAFHRGIANRGILDEAFTPHIQSSARFEPQPRHFSIPIPHEIGIVQRLVAQS